MDCPHRYRWVPPWHYSVATPVWKEFNKCTYVILNDAACLIYNLPWHSRSTPLLQHLYWVPISQWIYFKTLCLVFKALPTDTPPFVSRRLHQHIPGRLLRSSSACLLTVPRFRKTRSEGKAFSVLAPTLWNSLTLSLKEEVDFLKFRKKLKANLFAQAFVLSA